MNTKLVVFLLLIVVVAALLWWSGREIVPKREAMIWDTTKTDAALVRQNYHQPGVLPKVDHVVLAVELPDKKQVGPFEFVPGKMTGIPESEYSIKATDFYTHWNWDGKPVNLSLHETNPAVKVEVYHNDELIYYTWGFKNLPFFRRSTMMGESPEQLEQIAFTLVSYEGLSIPNQKTQEGVQQ